MKFFGLIFILLLSLQVKAYELVPYQACKEIPGDSEVAKNGDMAFIVSADKKSGVAYSLSNCEKLQTVELNAPWSLSGDIHHILVGKELFDLTTGEHRTLNYACAGGTLSYTGKYLFSIHNEGDLFRISTIADGQTFLAGPLSHNPSAKARFSYGDKIVGVNDGTQSTVFYNLETGVQLLKIRGTTDYSIDMTGTRLLVREDLVTGMNVYDLVSQSEVPVLHLERYGAATFTPDGRYLASSPFNQSTPGILVNDTTTGKKHRSFNFPDISVVTRLALTDGAELGFVEARDLYVVDLTTHKLDRLLTHEEDGFSGFMYTSNGIIATAICGTSGRECVTKFFTLH